jgi:hypothetical protein
MGDSGFFWKTKVHPSEFLVSSKAFLETGVNTFWTVAGHHTNVHFPAVLQRVVFAGHVL